MDRLGLIGAGSMARALALGWGDPVVASDSGSGRAAALVERLGGETGTNAEVAARCRTLLLAHKPAQLDAVAAGLDGFDGLVISVLGGVRLDALRVAYPAARVAVVMPNTPAEVGAGVSLLAVGSDEREAVIERFARVGSVVEVPEALFPAATGIAGVGPAYVALVAESWVDAGVRAGLKPAVATELVLATLAGSAALLRASDGDTLGVRRAVTSPGGTTAKGLRALADGGLPAAFHDAMDATSGTSR